MFQHNCEFHINHLTTTTGRMSRMLKYDAAPRDIPSGEKLPRWISSAALEWPITPVTSSWIEHTPFALWVMDALRPRCFVELGTLHGVSYFTFCQGSARNGGSTRCFAIDTWQGDEHTGTYSEDVWEHVKRINSERFAPFSTLLRRTFDEAASLFADGSIDLLHIDGLHTYEAVRHDWETWQPKLSASGVVLLHDTNVYERDFGVSKLMRELECRHPVFEFMHGHGLGVVAAGAEMPTALRPLFDALHDPAQASMIRSVYARLGSSVSERLALQHEQSLVARLRTDIATVQQDAATHSAARERTEAARAEAEAALAATRAEAEAALAATRAEAEAALAATRAEAETALAATRTEAEAADERSQALMRERLQAVQAELQQYKETLHFALAHRNALLSSTSWRITAPMRVAATWFHAQRRLPRNRPSASMIWRATEFLRRTVERFPILRRMPGFSLLRRVAWTLRGNRPPREEAVLSRQPSVSAPQSAPRPRVDELAFQPLISIITPVYNVPAVWLRRAVASVQAQTYARWEFCLCDDGSTRQDTLDVLAELAESGDPRLRVTRLPANVGISGATNAALQLAQGEFVAFMDNDDELAPHALEACVQALNQDRTIDVIYSDEDKLGYDGQQEEPFYKPDWSPQFLREVMYVGHLLVARSSLVREIGGLDATYDGVQDFELMLRLSERTRKIHHVRDILYHWRRIPGSVADRTDAKPRLGEKQVAAVNAHLRRLGIAAEATLHPTLAHRVRLVPMPRSETPRISIIIPTKDAPELISRCLDSIFQRTTYPDFEVVVVDNGTTDPTALAAIARHEVTRVEYKERFNFSRANNLGVAAATGSILVLLNNDTEVSEPDWLDQMLALLDDQDVAAVGPLLLYPDGKVQHAGVALGMRGTADHVLRYLDPDSDGYFGSLACTREVSAVTCACMMLRRADYLALGGLNELFQTHYQDVDLCMRLREDGRRILFTPRTRMIHHESATRGSDYDMIDRELLIDSWRHLIADGDPFCRWEPEARGGQS
jgi:GT2 family glycosyltransferase